MEQTILVFRAAQAARGIPMEVVKLLEKQGIGGAAQPPDCMHIASCWIQTIQAKRSLQKTGGTASPSVALGRLIDKPRNPKPMQGNQTQEDQTKPSKTFRLCLKTSGHSMKISFSVAF